MGSESSSFRPKRHPSDSPDAPNKKRPPVGDEAPLADAEDAITQDEIHGAELQSDKPSKSGKIRNAFSELMAPKPKPETKAVSASSRTNTNSFGGRDGLGLYIAKPETLPAGSIIFANPRFVAIHDMYPKATVHCLLLPRSPDKTLLHPFDAFEDAEFLASVRAEAANLKDLVARELQRLVGEHSAAEAPRRAVLEGEVEPERDAEGRAVIPQGRDWMSEVKVGVHARPSMNHIHVHVLSRDMYSNRLKVRKHYNSFTTDFFVPLDDFPLAMDDPRRNQAGWHEKPMVCWRCGRDFGNKLKELKKHLGEEFDEWKRE
ncbi:HIT domain-containing protein [Diaporthe eres]|uniref:HIT domain-containing protein n=1 Tax=Diaporthe vaccinii TaxID=105482 RepID=A0ABR4ED82_9PEZI|nr:HIT domain-containing protein [Diaporthe eres]